MRLTTEAVLRDIQEELKQREDLPTWGNTEALLTECEQHIESLDRQLYQQQAEIEALKNARCVACGWNPKLLTGELK